MFGSLNPLRRRRRTRWRCKHLDTPIKVSARQESIPGWDQEKLSCSTGLLVGAGGIGGGIGEGLVGKGVGTLHIADFDIVTPSNLNRQKFVKKSLYRNKAIELARILSTRGFLGTELVAHPCSFQELDLDEISPTFVVGAVDNQLPDTRLEICRACYGRDIAGVILGVDRNADRGYVFVQAPGEACWACVFKPDMAVDSSEGDNEQKQCPGEPACIDILEVVAGHALYAIDTLLMARKRDWNYRVVSLSKGQFSSATMVPPRKGCPVCGTQERQT